MLLFEVVSDAVVLAVGPFAQMTAWANEQRQRGTQVLVRRAQAPHPTPRARAWAVQLYAAGSTDVLHCLDEADARATLRAVLAHGIRARIVCR